MSEILMLAVAIWAALFVSLIFRLYWLLKVARLWPIGAELREQLNGTRQWRPRSPLDCAACCAMAPPHSGILVEIQPWSQIRNRRGAKKRIDSQGQACKNPACVYYNNPAAAVHAMVSDGVRGKTDSIRRWKCQACGRTVTERHNTVLFHLKTPPPLICRIMHALSLGVDMSAASQIFDKDPRTVDCWLKRSGSHAIRLHELYFQRLRSQFVQLDELVAQIRGDPDRTFVWTAVDAGSKIMLQIHVGRRLIEDAYAFVHALCHRLAIDHVPAFSSDGLRHYFSALTAHFGHWIAPVGRQRKSRWLVDERLLFGMLYKIKAGRKLKDMYTRIRCGTRNAWQQRLTALGFTGKVQTAIVERANLTMRETIAPLARRTWSIARSQESLKLMIHWTMCCYHFVRPHMSLSTRRRPRTPAMAAGLTDRVWRAEEVLRFKIHFL